MKNGNVNAVESQEKAGDRVLNEEEMNKAFGLDEDVEVEVERDLELEAWEHSQIIISLKVYERMAARLEKEISENEALPKAERKTLPAFPDVLGLFMHYYYSARRQKTNQPWATASYCKKWFGWGTDKFQRTKAFLVNHGFIENVQKRGEKSQFARHYVKIRSMPKSHSTCFGEGGKSHSTCYPESGSVPGVVNRETNALNNKNLNAYNQNNNAPVVVVVESAPQKEENQLLENLYLQYGEQVVDEAFRNIPAGVNNPTGWVIAALKGGYGKDPKHPRGAIPDENVSKYNGPGVHWDEGNNTRVQLGARWYQETIIEGSIFYVPEE